MRIVLFLNIFLLIFPLYGQITDNFDDGDLNSNPAWQGDVQNFKIDEALSLRLNAPDQGNSSIFTSLIFPDSFELKLDLKLEFSPSTSNLCEIYFMSVDQNLNTSDCYYISIGENGNEDALRFYKRISGQKTLLASGKIGAMSTDPSIAKLKINYTNNGFFNIDADYDDNGEYEDVFNFTDGSILPSVCAIFGIKCFYTATRKDKFVFDNLSVLQKQNDVKAPNALKVELIDEKNLNIFFDEPLDKSAAELTSNYQINILGSPVKATLSAPNKVSLEFDQEFNSSEKNILSYNNIKDKAGNLASGKLEFDFTSSPKRGDLVLSEILFDPYVNKEDFIEIYNASIKRLSLKNLIIRNRSNGQSKTITSETIINPNSYIAFTKSSPSLADVYDAPVQNIIDNDLPAFNNDAGFASIELSDGTVLDEFEYSDKWHLFPDEQKTNNEGVSLEKIKLLPLNNERINWHSANKLFLYATPGYENSHLKDKIKPIITSYRVLNDKQILFCFNDVMDITSVLNSDNYLYKEISEKPLDIEYEDDNPSKVILTFLSSFNTDRSFIIEIKNVKDKNQNVIENTSIEGFYGLAPKPGELIISEILFNPVSPSDDFIELYNSSNNGIQLNGLKIKNNTSKNEEIVLKDFVLLPGKYVAITETSESIKNQYSSPDSASIIENELPSFNLDKGNVSILNENIVLDSFTYDEELHNPLIDGENRKGVSLEKILLQAFQNTKSNWQSSAKRNNYATPGYKNSNFISNFIANEKIFLTKKSFSPNGDGSDDLLILQYKLDKPGYIANIEVYSMEGFLVKNIAKNELLGQEGIVTWDGTNNDGSRERLGIYIIKGIIFDAGGDTISFKKDCVFADFID